jgi:hypothetical protein
MSDEQPTLAAGPQPESAVDVPVGAVGGPVLDESRRVLLAAVLDWIIPPNGQLPAAGALGVGAVIERTLAGSAPLRRLMLDGLTEIDVAAGSAGFAALDAAARVPLLRAVETSHPAFFAALVSHAYRGYYTNPVVLQFLERATGYPARPPQPLGQAIEPWDEGLLARQRQRAPFWRQADPHGAPAQ